jgi:hypothetical protein
MSPIASFVLFLTSLFIGSEGSKIEPRSYPPAILLVSLASLYLLGPTSIGFGLCIGSGWVLLNQVADRNFPLQ